MASRPGIGTLVAAVLLPPLGIFLARGLGRDFLIDAVLTLVGWLPGVAFALFTVLRQPRIAARA